jgi:hypothetical protein
MAWGISRYRQQRLRPTDFMHVQTQAARGHVLMLEHGRNRFAGSLSAAADGVSQHRPSRTNANEIHAGGPHLKIPLSTTCTITSPTRIDQIPIGTVHVQSQIIAKVIENSTIAIGRDSTTPGSSIA